ncbi:MAG: type II secretion system GspH family protein [Alphaproteobacteria bacterium]|nr:type II secretion system GspH family protein [Alphaproteobacteria bacterium]
MTSMTFLRRQRGFTLTEAVLVFAFVGFLMAAIWAAATHTRARLNISDTAATAMEIANTVRAIYGMHIMAAPPTDIEGQIAAGLFPAYAIPNVGTHVVNAWNGEILLHFHRTTDTNGNSITRGFTIEFTLPDVAPDASRAICTDMMVALRGNRGDYTGTHSGFMPADVLPLEPTQDGGPFFSYINRGGEWINATALAPTALFTVGRQRCDGFAFYFRV